MANKKNDSFLPEGYKYSSSSGNVYLKFDEGETKIRILSQAFIGYVAWADDQGNIRQRGERPHQGDKPQRYSREDAPDEVKANGKEFWLVLVWNYDQNKIMLWDITQKSIKDQIVDLAQSEDWGDPRNYDIKVKREGEGLKTRYTVLPVPAKELDPEIKKQVDNLEYDLSNYVKGKPVFTSLTKEELEMHKAMDEEPVEVETVEEEELTTDDLPF